MKRLRCGLALGVAGVGHDDIDVNREGNVTWAELQQRQHGSGRFKLLHDRSPDQVLTQVWTLVFAMMHVGGAAAVTLDAVLRKRHVSAVIG